MSEAERKPNLEREAALLIATTRRASLATRLAGSEQAGVQAAFPYVSLVLLAPDAGGLPFLLLSDLSEHAKNLQADPALALLLEQTADKPDPLAEPRLTFLGEASQVSDAEAAEPLREAFVAAHPHSESWARFTDFKPYRLNCRNLHFVAGFGRIAWLSPDRVIQHLLLASDAGNGG